MKKLFFLLASMFLLAGCIESVAVFGGGAANGKMVQSSFQSGASYAIKKKKRKTPLSNALNYAKKKKNKKIKNSCSSFNNKKDLEICLLVKKRIIFSKTRIKEKEFSDQHSNQPISSLRSSINKKSKIKYLD